MAWSALLMCPVAESLFATAETADGVPFPDTPDWAYFITFQKPPCRCKKLD